MIKYLDINLIKMNNIFETRYSAKEEQECKPLKENLDSYFQHYDAELRQQYGQEYVEKLQVIETDLHNLPIAHTTNIQHIEQILANGLKTFSHRGETNYSKSAIFQQDHQYGLDNYVFANIGFCPSYGSEKGRVTILLDDSVVEQKGSFFTFHDLVAATWDDDPRFRAFGERIRKQFPQEKLPLSAVYGILARAFLKSGKTIDEFLQDRYLGFPKAYDPDFQNTNSGSPEIKIAGIVLPDNFIGYVVRDEETRQSLLSKGVTSEEIILSTDSANDKRLIYEYKIKLLQQEDIRSKIKNVLK